MTDHVLKFWKFALGIPESQEFKFKGTPVTPKFSATSTSDTGWACKRFWYARTCSRSFIALSSLVGLGLSTLPGEPKMCCVFVRHGKVWENDFAQEVLEFRSVLMSFDRGRFVVVHPCSSLSLRRWVAKMPKLKMVSNLGFLPLKGDRISWSLRSFAHKCLLHCAKFGPGLVKAKVGVQIRVEVKVNTFTSTRRSWSGLESGSVTESGVGVLIWVCIRFQVGVWIRICVWFRVKVPVRVWIWVRSLGLDLTPSLIRIQFFSEFGYRSESGSDADTDSNFVSDLDLDPGFGSESGSDFRSESRSMSETGSASGSSQSVFKVKVKVGVQIWICEYELRGFVFP